MRRAGSFRAGSQVEVIRVLDGLPFAPGSRCLCQIARGGLSLFAHPPWRLGS